MSGRFITMMFGLLGACLAMYQARLNAENKNASRGCCSAALTSFLTGIPRAYQFSFLFIAPVLHVIHAFLTTGVYARAYFISPLGQTLLRRFSIDFVLFGILQGEAKTHWMLVPLVCTVVLPLLLHVFAI